MAKRMNPAAVALGRLGGKSTSPAKTRAARRNGRKGGAPPPNRVWSRHMTAWEKRRRRRAPLKVALAPLEVCWKLRSPTGRVLECGIYVLEGGIYAVATG